MVAATGTGGVAWSRTYLQAHWLTDVAAGALLGSVLSRVTFAVGKRRQAAAVGARVEASPGDRDQLGHDAGTPGDLTTADMHAMSRGRRVQAVSVLTDDHEHRPSVGTPSAGPNRPFLLPATRMPHHPPFARGIDLAELCLPRDMHRSFQPGPMSTLILHVLNVPPTKSCGSSATGLVHAGT